MDVKNNDVQLKVLDGASSKLEQYYNNLKEKLNNVHPTVLSCDTWTSKYINETLKLYYYMGRSLEFNELPKIPKAELKLYWIKLLSDKRKTSEDQLNNRIRPTIWLSEEWDKLSKHFNVSCIADVPYPTFSHFDHTTNVINKHNQDFLNLYHLWVKKTKKHSYRQVQKYAKGNTIVKKEYFSNRVNIAGDVHRRIVIQREQFPPIHKRNIVFYNDLYSEETTRSKDRQRTDDKFLNFYRYPYWMRDAMRIHLFDKIEHGELAPSTLTNYFGNFVYLVKFLYQKFDNPSPKVITSSLIEDDYLSWGNEKKLSGKNWFTNNAALLSTASKAFPDIWPSLTISPRATRKITKTHYKTGLGRMQYHQECIGRSIPENVLKELINNLEKLPAPIPAIFMLTLTLGSRSEDTHAMLYDCIEQDPHDEKFMLLTFWQNKVSKWNTKPLLKSDDSHNKIIDIILEQQKHIKNKYKKKTHYLFPQFVGDKESFLTPNWTRMEMKKLIVKNKVVDKLGKPYKFGWHQLRHHRGTEMAEQGHDIVAIMMELGHTAPDMAANYVNNRLQLKKKALMEKGGGRFYTIEGEVDNKIGDLLIRKQQLAATRVCGGACALPGQLGTWCHHANACLTCKHFRADEKDISYFQHERNELLKLLEDQENEAKEQFGLGHNRMADIVKNRQSKNKGIIKSLDKIIHAIENHRTFKGQEEKLEKDTESPS